MFGSTVAYPKSVSKAREVRLRKNRVVWVKYCPRAFEVSNAQNHG
jgi:hypothetical protein